MTHYHTQLALLCLLITIVLQAYAGSIPPQLLTAARVIQVILGVLCIYIGAQMILGQTSL